MCNHADSVEFDAVDGATNHGIRCYHVCDKSNPGPRRPAPADTGQLPTTMMNHPHSWIWYGRRRQLPHRATAPHISQTVTSASPAPPPTQWTGNGPTCLVSGCGRAFPTAATARQHALEHLRLIPPWSNELIHAGQLSPNAFRQYRGCCDACGAVCSARSYLDTHVAAGGVLCRRTGPIDAAALYAKCCVVRDETERDLPLVCIRGTQAPVIRVEWFRYPAGMPLSPAATGFLLSKVAVSQPPEMDAPAPTAVYRPVPITDLFGISDEVKTAHLVSQPPTSQAATPPQWPQPQAGLPADPAEFELLLVSPVPGPAWHWSTTTPGYAEPEPHGSESEYDSESGCESESQYGSEAEDGESA